jgi:hypothetical protein
MTAASASSVKMMDVLNAFGEAIVVDYKRVYTPMSNDRHAIVDAFFASGGDFYTSTHTSTCMCGCKETTYFSQSMSYRPVTHVKDFYDYLFAKNYVNKTDIEFQEEIFDTLRGYGFYDLQGLEKDGTYFEYALNNLMLPEYIIKLIDYGEDGKDSLFHRLFNYALLPPEFMERMFAIFDASGFDYKTPGCKSLMARAISSNHIYAIGELLSRGLTLDSADVESAVVRMLRRTVCVLRDECDEVERFESDVFWKTVYATIYTNPLYIRLFAGEPDDEKVKTNMIDLMKLIDPDYESLAAPRSTMYDSYKNNLKEKYTRDRLFANADLWADCLNTLRFIIAHGFIKDKKIVALEDDMYGAKPIAARTMIDLYRRGSRVIEVLYPELHAEFMSAL